MEAATYSGFAFHAYFTLHLFSEHLGNGQAQSYSGLKHVIFPEYVEHLV